MRHPALEAGQADHLDQLGDALALGRHAPEPAAAQPEADVRGDREVREQRAFLRDVADAAPLRRRVLPRAVDDAAGEGDRAPVGPLETGDQAEERRLAAAGRAEDRRQRAGLDGRARRRSGRRLSPRDFSRPDTATAILRARRPVTPPASGDPFEPASRGARREASRRAAGRARKGQRRRRRSSSCRPRTAWRASSTPVGWSTRVAVSSVPAARPRRPRSCRPAGPWTAAGGRRARAPRRPRGGWVPPSPGRAAPRSSAGRRGRAPTITIAGAHPDRSLRRRDASRAPGAARGGGARRARRSARR